MHSYLRAIGFSKLKNKRAQNQLITAALNDATCRKEIDVAADTRLIQVDRDFDGGLGIAVIGEYDMEDTLIVDHIFPYCKGSHTTYQSNIQIEPHTDKEAYSAVSDDYNLGITLIYNLQNIVDYVRSTWLNEHYQIPKNVNFGALSIEGRIICGVHLDYMACPYDKQPISNNARRELIAKARSGDMDALESLTLDDMDTYSLVTKRIKDEDLLTVVETYFMPYGIDNEHYSILGIIQKIEQITNEISDEMVYNLTVLCNDITLNIGINSLDLQGEPKIGRRFKGIIWLQGCVDFA
ncbi:MAG: DUF3881 family protein [Lachnospiraceae bacterium]|nr:DUF3881 family protein [Lachnospiraceae bacterium]MDE6626475.1 DUF3881 family protein [Lachnospiraceae bacterium]